MTTLAQTFAKNIRALRSAKHLTQAQLAHTIGCSVEWVRRIEKGGTSPSFTTIEDLAQALGVQPGQLFEDHSNAQPPRLLVNAARNLTRAEADWLLQGVELLRATGKSNGKKPLRSRRS